MTCFLPHFNLATAKDVVDIMTGAKQDSDGSQPSSHRVLIDPITMLWNQSLPVEVAESLASLPSQAAPKTPAKPVRRLLKMAAEIALDDLLPDANAQAYDQLYSVLDGQVAQYKNTVKHNVADSLTADIRRVTANRLTKQSTESVRQVAADDRTVVDAFRLAVRAYGAAIANGYAKRLAVEAGDEDEDFDIYAAKARVAALAMIPEVADQVESTADQIVKDWFSVLHAPIRGLSEERRSTYDDIRLQAKDPQEIDLVVPVSRIEMTTKVEGGKATPVATRDRHVLSDSNGAYPVDLNVWELKVLDTEMARDSAVAWYRNPSSASKDAVHVPWWDGQRWRSMQPDFIFFSTKADGSVASSIVDPMATT